MMAAHRFPTEFDSIVADTPGFRFPRGHRADLI